MIEKDKGKVPDRHGPYGWSEKTLSAHLLYELYDDVPQDYALMPPRRREALSDEDTMLLSDIMEYFFYPDQASIAREVFTQALAVAASRILRQYAK